jgi:ABC-type sulfate transport system permease component
MGSTNLMFFAVRPWVMERCLLRGKRIADAVILLPEAMERLQIGDEP